MRGILPHSIYVVMDTTNTMMTAEEYREIRDELGLSQEKLARALHISTSTVQKRESGASPIDHEAAVAIRALRDLEAA